MVLYFSGTGNSGYAAVKIGKAVGDEVLNLFDKIRNRDFSDVSSDKPWVIVAPTYSWRIPRIVEQWLRNTKLNGNKDVYFVMTCGDNIGNAGAYAEKICVEKGLRFKGCVPVVMPENYIALFSTPGYDEARAIIERAQDGLQKIAQLIKNDAEYVPAKITLADRVCSGIVNDLFYPVFVRSKKFYATDACVGCKMCESVCPLKNVSVADGKPAWGKNCTHCMACISKCPSGAIEYGKHSIGTARYICPERP